MEVIEFEKIKKDNEIDVNEILEGFKDTLEDVLIVGYTKDGLMLFNSSMNSSESVFALETTKQSIIQKQFE